MLTSRVKKYELSYDEEQAIRTVRNIVNELWDEEFFEEEPFDNYCPDEIVSLMNDLLENDGSAIG